MSTSRATRNARRRAATPAIPAVPSPAAQLEAIKAKFEELAGLRVQIAGAKNLYTRHDALVTELMPLFIQQTPEGFTVRSSFTIGNKTYRFTPSFFAEGEFKVKRWKSGAYPTGVIES